MEFIIFNCFDERWMPNILMLIIIFVHLAMGRNTSLFAAIVAGLIKDSFSADMFGFNLYSFLICSYALTLIIKHVYRRGSPSSRLLVVFICVILNFFVQYFIYLANDAISFVDAFRFILVPELLLTLFLAPFIFKQLEKCVSKLFVLS